MSSSDDPPFLNVGTEVSAKYRGAFCEATIKIAKKLVKCKVSYTQGGGTEVVSNDVIKGPLKVNAGVEVRRSDGQYISGVLTRLTDASTYTVVFDDGDERTLKRSSLCLKGARHYSASESLDQMPLTDPENFGTPAHYQSKRGQRKRQHQLSSSPESGNDQTPIVLSPPKKQAPTPTTATTTSSPAPPPATPIITNKRNHSEEFPVGRCVFLENDRRRSCWLPAVVVPSHYVMEESETSDDTICIRSFKDGRFYAARVNELHSFSPDKEPLSSMLDGEIQAMFMCKPAIERAMAYLDTGELPWDMELMDTKESTNNKEDEESEDKSAERENFYKRLKNFQEEKGIIVNQKPLLCHKELDLYKLHCLVKENGGMERVTQELKWRSLYLQLGLPPATSASHIIKQAYKKYLNAFDVYERAKNDTKSPRVYRKRVQIANATPPNATPLPVDSGDESIDSKVIKLEVPENEEVAAPVISLPPPLPPPPPISSSSTESMGESSSAEKLEEGGGARGGAQVDEIKVNDRIKVLYGKGKTLQTYEAKVLEVDNGRYQFYVHYNGWNTRYDEWVDSSRIVEKVTTPSKGVTRPPYARKKQVKLRQKAVKDNNGTQHSPADKSHETTPTSSSSSTPNIPSTTPTNERTTKPTKSKRRRTSSTTETSNSNSNSDTPSSPIMGCPVISIKPSIIVLNGPKHSQHTSPPPPPPPPPPTLHQPPSPSPPPPLQPDPAHSSQRDSSPSISDGTTPIKAQGDECSSSEEEPVTVKREEDKMEENTNEEEKGREGDYNHPCTDDHSVTNTRPSPPNPPLSANNTIVTNNNLVTNNSTVTSPSVSSYPEVPVIITSLMGIQTLAHSASDTQPFYAQSVTQLSSSPSFVKEEAETDVKDTPPCDHQSSSSPSQDESMATSDDRMGGIVGGATDDKAIDRNDLDFSIDMSIYIGLSSGDRITLIQDRMKAIQHKYMELKSEVSYLDRKRRKARKREREVARLMAARGGAAGEDETLGSSFMPSSSIQGITIESAS